MNGRVAAVLGVGPGLGAAVARRFAVDLAPYPTLTRVEAVCEALPAFQKAHALAQPDAEG